MTGVGEELAYSGPTAVAGRARGRDVVENLVDGRAEAADFGPVVGIGTRTRGAVSP